MRNFIAFTFILVGCFAHAQSSGSDTIIAPTDSATAGLLVIHADERIDKLMTRYKKENEGTKIDGYRVQLFSGNRKGAFDHRAKFMRKLSGYEVTVIYDSPNFKTQAGNFRTRLEAEKALEEIWPIYKSAFVVKTKIDLPTLPIEQDKK